MNVGSLFSGIGGLDLGLERAGMAVVWQSEIDPYASKVLAKHWPAVPNLGDITLIDWSTVERPDVICGGYPCQPFSLAGTRAGADDPRHLWPHFARAIRHLRPRYALLENVPGHLSLGFDRVLGDLAEIGYDTEWCSIPAAAVGAPHLRWRIFAVAYPKRQGDSRGRPEQSARNSRGGAAIVADTDELVGSTSRSLGVFANTSARRCVNGIDGCSGPIGDHWLVEPDVGRVAHGVPSRVDRLRCLGNAVVPQVAEWIGRRIMKVAA